MIIKFIFIINLQRDFKLKKFPVKIQNNFLISCAWQNINDKVDKEKTNRPDPIRFTVIQFFIRNITEVTFFCPQTRFQGPKTFLN